MTSGARATGRLGVGFIGSGFNARFHMQAFRGVRDADVLGVWSPHSQNAESAAALARSLDVGEARAHRSITEMIADPAIDALWLTGPNHARIENVEEIVDAIERGVGTLRGIACEKPLARNVGEAERVCELVARVGLQHGYLENQVFAPQVDAGRDLLWARGARATGRPYDSEKEGVLVTRVDSLFLQATDFSPPCQPSKADKDRVFEIRTYTATPGNLERLLKRFRDHTLQLFSQHGMTNVFYWTLTPGQKGAENTLIYVLAHASQNAAETSFKEFRADPEWVRVKDESEKDAGGSLTVVPDGVKSVFVRPTVYSPTF